MTAVKPSITDYTNRDYESLLWSLLESAALKVPEWTDRSENDLGRLLLESFAYVGDVLLYYQDRIANEAFLSTAVERQSVIDLLSLIGYTLATSAPASAELRLIAPNDSDEPIRVEVGALFATQVLPGEAPLEFMYWPADGQPLEIPRDGRGGVLVYPPDEQIKEKNYKPLIVIHATQHQEEDLGEVTQAPNQRFRLTQKPVLLLRDLGFRHTLTVEVGSKENGFQRWAYQDTLLNSNSADQHYMVQIDENDAAEIIFGDGQYGQIPPGPKLRATYLTGGGTIGNVGQDTITVVKSGVSVQGVKVTNPTAASGGADRETIEHARLHAPSVFRSQQRAVTAADYEALAKTVPGVAYVKAEAPAWNYVDLYVVATGNTAPKDDLRARLYDFFEKRRMVTTTVHVRAPVFIKIFITVVELGVEPNFYREDVKKRVNAALLTELFGQPTFGQPFYLSKVYEAIEAVAGVAFVRGVSIDGRFINKPVPRGAKQGLLQLGTREFPQPGDFYLPMSGGFEVVQER